MFTDTRMDARLPAVRQAPRGSETFRDDREGASKNPLTSFVVVFKDDEVTISSRKNTENNVRQGQFPQVPAPENDHPVVKRMDEKTRLQLVDQLKPTMYSETVKDSGSISPYDLNANMRAIGRYREASSYRDWHSSTFQIIV